LNIAITIKNRASNENSSKTDTPVNGNKAVFATKNLGSKSGKLPTEVVCNDSCKNTIKRLEFMREDHIDQMMLDTQTISKSIKEKQSTIWNQPDSRVEFQDSFTGDDETKLVVDISLCP
jgi:hypothetical protein